MWLETGFVHDDYDLSILLVELALLNHPLRDIKLSLINMPTVPS